MPTFDGVQDAKRIIQAAWNAFNPHGQVQGNIGPDPVTVTWRFRSGTTDSGTDVRWEFTGDQGALTRWWAACGSDYKVLPPGR